jgi:hypothetical protein
VCLQEHRVRPEGHKNTGNQPFGIVNDEKQKEKHAAHQFFRSLLGILVIGVLWLRTRKFPWRSLGVLCCLLSIALSLQRVVWVLQDRTAGWTPAARLASRAGSIADKQPLFLLGNQPGGGLAGPTILYYSNRYLQRVASPAELGDFITRDGPLAVIFIKRDLPELSSSYHVRALAEEGNLEYAEINRLY